MDFFKNLAGFDEKYAKMSIKAHKTFGGKVVEVLYGAVDANGNPTLPKDGADDGHGRWYGIESGGNYKMFSWTHPASEGGETEYGTSHGEHAVEDMEADIKKKKDLCLRAEHLEAGDAEALQEVQNEWNALENWGTALEEECQVRFDKAIALYESKLEKAEQNAQLKADIVRRAQELKDSTKWNNTRQEFEGLWDEWKNTGYGGAKDDELYEAFNSARKEFNTKRKEYYANLDQVRAAAAEKKQALIEETKTVVENIKNFRATGQKMDELMASWKAAGSAGHEKDETLWEEFNGLREKFYDARREFNAEQNEKRKQSTEIKKRLIEEAKTISEGGDFSKETTERMKEMDKEWKEAGYSGRNNNDALWEEYRAAKEAFWDGKHADTQKRFQGALERRESTLSAIRSEINDLEEKQFETSDYEEISRMQRQIENKKAKLEALKGDIEELKGKIETPEEAPVKEEAAPAAEEAVEAAAEAVEETTEE